jgi:hypothetical protein
MGGVSMNKTQKRLIVAGASIAVLSWAFIIARLVGPTLLAQSYNIENRSNLPSGVLLPGKGADLASGTTITPTNMMHNVTGITAVAAITAPSGIQAGQMLILVPKGIIAIGTGGNVQIAVTTVVDKALILIWDGSKWIPTYLL